VSSLTIAFLPNFEFITSQQFANTSLPEPLPALLQCGGMEPTEILL
jgi:hypothetical protein